MNRPCLLIDLGNTRLKWALRSGTTLGSVTSLPHQGGQLPPEFWAALPPVQTAVCASVGPESLTHALLAGLQTRGITVRWVSANPAGCGVRNGYFQPERLGVDRWLALLGARQHTAGAVLVVSAGTALTLDLLDAQGQHQGGLIAPGLSLLRKTLHAKVPALPATPATLLGATTLARATEPALANGALYCALGLIERVYADVCVSHAPLTLLLHGGDADYLSTNLSIPWQLVPELVFWGLMCWTEAYTCEE